MIQIREWEKVKIHFNLMRIKRKWKIEKMKNWENKKIRKLKNKKKRLNVKMLMLKLGLMRKWGISFFGKSSFPSSKIYKWVKRYPIQVE